MKNHLDKNYEASFEKCKHEVNEVNEVKWKNINFKLKFK